MVILPVVPPDRTEGYGVAPPPRTILSHPIPPGSSRRWPTSHPPRDPPQPSDGSREIPLLRAYGLNGWGPGRRRARGSAPTTTSLLRPTSPASPPSSPQGEGHPPPAPQKECGIGGGAAELPRRVFQEPAPAAPPENQRGVNSPPPPSPLRGREIEGPPARPAGGPAPPTCRVHSLRCPPSRLATRAPARSGAWGRPLPFLDTPPPPHRDRLPEYHPIQRKPLGPRPEALRELGRPTQPQGDKPIPDHRSSGSGREGVQRGLGKEARSMRPPGSVPPGIHPRGLDRVPPWVTGGGSTVRSTGTTADRPGETSTPATTRAVISHRLPPGPM